MVLYIRYTLCFIAYTSPLPPARTSPPTVLTPCPRFLFAARRGCMQNARAARFSESADIMPLAYSLCFRPGLASFDSDILGSPFHAFSPFFSHSLPSRLPAITFVSLSPSLARSLLPTPFFLFLPPPPPRFRRRNIFPEHYFYRSTAVRTCVRSAMLSAN